MLLAVASHVSGPSSAELQYLDVFHPLFDPQMLELFPDGELPDLALLETSSLNLDYLDITDWNSTAASIGGSVGANMAISDWNSKHLEGGQFESLGTWGRDISGFGQQESVS